MLERLQPEFLGQEPELAIIIPVYNEAASVLENLKRLENTIERQFAINHQKNIQQIEIIVVDGGSTDGSIELLKNHSSQLTFLTSRAGRARQMNAGASVARAKKLLFLHIDTFLPENFYQAIMSALNSQKNQQSEQSSVARWGRFDVQLSSTKIWARLVSFMINWRSRTFSIATGDQALFMTRQAFDRVAGFAQQPLMEDVEMSKRLKQCCAAPICLSEKVITSSRRWEKHGVVRTILLMWQLRLYYYFGVSADKLHKKYYE